MPVGKRHDHASSVMRHVTPVNADIAPYYGDAAREACLLRSTRQVTQAGLQRKVRDRQEIYFTIWLANLLSRIVTLSGAKGLAARFFASLRMTLV